MSLPRENRLSAACLARPIVRDPAHAAALAADGWVQTQFLTRDQTAELRRIVSAAQQGVRLDDQYCATPFRLTCFHNSGEYRARLYHAVHTFVRQALDALLVEYDPLVVNLFQKLPGGGGVPDGVAIHQNPSFVDEPRFKSVSVWIPLVDAERHNGTLGVLRGSHDVLHQARAVNMPQEMWDPVKDALTEEYFEALRVPAGDAVVLDDSVLHWSYPNQSDRPRDAIQMICVPRGEPLTYSFYRTDGGPPRIENFPIDKDYFFRFQYHARPVDLPMTSEIPYEYKPLEEDELERLVGPRNPDLVRKIAARRSRLAASGSAK